MILPNKFQECGIQNKYQILIYGLKKLFKVATHKKTQNEIQTKNFSELNNKFPIRGVHYLSFRCFLMNDTFYLFNSLLFLFLIFVYRHLLLLFVRIVSVVLVHLHAYKMMIAFGYRCGKDFKSVIWKKIQKYNTICMYTCVGMIVCVNVMWTWQFCLRHWTSM